MIINGFRGQQPAPAFTGATEQKKLASFLRRHSSMRFIACAQDGSLVRLMGKDFEAADLDSKVVQEAKKKAITRQPLDDFKQFIEDGFQLMREQLASKLTGKK